MALFMVWPLLTAGSLQAEMVSAGKPLEDYNETRAYFGAYFTVHCRYDNKLTDIHAATEKCWRKLDEVQVNMNATSTQGFLGLVNRADPNRGVQVSNDLYRIIADAISYSERTEGAFDITVYPLVQLWKRAAKQDKLPAQSEIDDTLQKVGSKFIRLDPDNTVILTQPGVSLDLNAIAPAFAVDRVAEILEENQVVNYMVDGSGEIRCKGDQEGQRGWRVGVQDPTKQHDQGVIDILILKDCAVSTSGNYERFYTIQGKRFSHIIDPRSGYPANGVVSATVIAPTAEEANAFSTPLCVLGGKAGMKLLSASKNVEAYVLEDVDGRLVPSETPGYHRFRTSR